MAGAIERKAAGQSLAAEETLLSIVTYKEGEMAAFDSEHHISKYREKHSYSTAFNMSMKPIVI